MTSLSFSIEYAFYLSFCLYPFVEAALVSKFATTAGKRLTGVFVFASDGNKLSYPASLKRSFLVFGAGMGFFMPYVSLIFPIYASIRLCRRKTAFWDRTVPDRVDCVKTTWLDKTLLTGFFLFLGAGFFLSVRMSHLYRQPDFVALEDNILGIYFEEIRPQAIQALSAETVLTPRSAKEAAEKMEEIQRSVHMQRAVLARFKADMQKRIDQTSDPDLRQKWQERLNASFSRLDSFLFSEKMRFELFGSILTRFESEEMNKPEFVDGRPVFKDAKMNRQYDQYMVQLQLFLSSDLPQED